MKLLLTGHKGFIGSHLLNALSTHEVVTYEWGEKLPVIDESYDWILHIGANSSTTERDVDKIMSQNYDFSVDLFEQAKRHGINFQYSSSASVYGLNQEFSENSPVDPKSPYAWTKYLFERYVEKNPGDIITQGFRYFNVYGPEGESHKGNQASPYYQFTEQAKTNKVIQVFEGSDNYLRDFVHVNTVVDVHQKFFSVKESGVWNVGMGKPTSFRDIAVMIALKYNASVKEIPMPEHLASQYQKYTCADVRKLQKTLNEKNIR